MSESVCAFFLASQVISPKQTEGKNKGVSVSTEAQPASNRAKLVPDIPRTFIHSLYNFSNCAQVFAHLRENDLLGLNDKLQTINPHFISKQIPLIDLN
jgi:hypothetical protein